VEIYCVLASFSLLGWVFYMLVKTLQKDEDVDVGVFLVYVSLAMIVSAGFSIVTVYKFMGGFVIYQAVWMGLWAILELFGLLVNSEAKDDDERLSEPLAIHILACLVAVLACIFNMVFLYQEGWLST